MTKGKQTCKILKEIRKQIAEENDIELIIEECTYKGDCLGTCPKCEAEVCYLERELEKRQRMGKVAVFSGMSLGMLFGASSCSDTFVPPQPLGGDVVCERPDSSRMATDTFSEQEIFGMVENGPCFNGGYSKMMEYIAENIHYPQEAIEKGIEGRVLVNIVVEKDGSIADVKLQEGIGGGCDEEAVRIVKSMPKWAPGKIKGQAQRMSYTIPVVFKLEDAQE